MQNIAQKERAQGVNPGPKYDKIAEKVYGMWQAFIRLASTTHVGNPAAIPVARTGLGL